MNTSSDEKPERSGDTSGVARRSVLKASAVTAAVAGASMLLPGTASAHDRGVDHGSGPRDSGRPGRRYVIKGGSVMSMDPAVGNFAVADVLVEGTKIVAVRPNINAAGASVIDARGRIVMPGFVDTHHHLFETSQRAFLANGLLVDDNSGSPSADPDYTEYILQRFSPVYRPQDVYINELFAGLSQLDAGVTTVLDVSQIHHSPEHSDAAIRALRDTGRRSAFGYFEGDGRASARYPRDAYRLREQYFSSDDQLLTMVMGGEIYITEEMYSESWKIARELDLQIAAHIVSGWGTRLIVDDIARGTGGTNNDLGFGPDNLLIHMTGMSDMAWQRARDAGAQVSVAFPIEMNMRHGVPPILKMQELGMEPSLSSDVETTMTADPFTQMRSAMTMQRMVVNQQILEQGDFTPPNQWPTPAPGTPELLTVRDVLRFGTINGAKHLRLDHKTGSLTPGKEADIVLLDATALNVAPLNSVPGAVVSLMERSNVETVIVAGKVRKWRGRLLDANLDRLRRELETSRDYLFRGAGLRQDLFGWS
ncbi:amidohydrolase family protein [Promicromonospora thailandica]|uniref:Cytosine/adenosine deaminase n=1 Tax=Promicromonospora thailandica TaxID=765201 RepID=A0A9X2JU62_9MICO|nr:amidohydrolase family protein [Promicromonospora thailandica]MCP2262683.1 Cytosine/adenosine deaminase [Promicromonospora thailandica]BFF18001.1 amidohydrolase family protein [Promicromonospora thailandica]